MWYVMQVSSRKEEEIIRMIKKSPSGKLMGECFLPYYERKRKFKGEWRIEKATLFPGYIFVETDSIQEFYFSLKLIPELTKILRAEDTWLPLYDEEERFLERLMDKDKIVKLSMGYIEGEQIIIKEGPMQGLEGLIKKIDRHKRIAVIEVELFMRKVEVNIGVEIIGKE